MKKIKKLLTVMLAVVMCFMTSMFFVACEDAYSADETDELIAKLQEIIDDNKTELRSKISELKQEFAAKNAELEDEIEEKEQAIADLKTEYEEQIEELAQKYGDNSQAIDDLTAEYKAKVEELEDAIASAREAMAGNRAELDSAIVELRSMIQNVISELADVLATIQNTDTTQTQKITELANKLAMLELEKRIVDLEYAANGDLIITFGDGTTQTVEAPQKEEILHTYGDWIDLIHDESTPLDKQLSYRICELCGSVEWIQRAYRKQDFTVEIGSYDTAKGTVSLDKDDYEYGDILTVTVSAQSGFYVKSFTVNGIEKKAELSSNSYTFELLDNTTINVVFKEREDLSIITNATVSSFDRDINRSGKVLVAFWAENCTYSVQYLAPQLEQLANDFGAGEEYAIDLDIKIIKVRASRDYNLSIANARYPEYEILTRYKSYHDGGTPFVVMLEDGEVIGTLNGVYREYNNFLSWMQDPSFI